MPASKVQMVRDYGCGLGGFTTAEPEVLEGLAAREGAVGNTDVLLAIGGQVMARITGAAQARTEAGGVIVVECPEALEAIEPGDTVRLVMTTRQVQNLTSGRSFTFSRHDRASGSPGSK